MNKFVNHSMAISKILSPNDTGETGAHQAGILIPKTSDILSFFPRLGNNEKNPREKLRFIDNDGEDWHFMFIYYNNKFFDGTRNEFRLTGMTTFIRQNNLMAGDKIILSREYDGRRIIQHEKVTSDVPSPVLRLGSSWKVVKI